MADRPRTYDVRVSWDHNDGGAVHVEGMPDIRVVKPKGEESTPDLYTPEHLFVAAATVCFMNSFIYFTRRMRIEFKSFECSATGFLEQVDRSFEVTRISTKSRLVIESEGLRQRFERALELGAKYCFVANSMKCPVTHENEIVVE
ncbi:OsmC family peroxiredoxin [Candidatus Thorarchaeota archaeon]|nr:MAG: OsmC family peroxiredoxin [Candidatus Thorarchaeota archaeon]